MDDPVVELHAIFHGDVQGVGFRFTIRRWADTMGITGSVKNLSDGTVELFAQGSKEDLKGLLEKLQSETGPGSVTSIHKEYSEPKQHFPTFEITF